MLGVSMVAGAVLERAKNHTDGPPTAIVVPSADNPTDWPKPDTPAPINLPPSWLQVESDRVKTQNAPYDPSSAGPTVTAVLPSAEIATVLPCAACPKAPEPTSFGPCCVHTPFARTKIHAAPTPWLSPGPPRIAVLPSPERATDAPRMANPAASDGVSFGPC